LRKLASLAGFVVVGLAAAFLFSSTLAGLTVSLGIIGAAVAFALQQVLASGVAWLQISVGKVYSVGDRVKMGGVVGDVIHINVFLTTLMEIGGDWIQADQYSGRIVRVPNSAIYQQPVYNYSSEFEFVWDELKVPIRYGSDRKKAVDIMHEAVAPLANEATEAMRGLWGNLKERYAIEDAILEPGIFLVANDNWLEYSIRYLVHYKKRRSTKSALCERIVSAIETNSESVSIASGTYDIVGLPPVTVNLRDPSAIASKSLE
jgi:small-conductance mechanosensitive channel